MQQLALSINCVIFGYSNESLQVLLIKRQGEPFKSERALCGKMLEANESLDTAVDGLLEEVTGFSDPYHRQLQAFGGTERHPLGRVISIAYYCLLDMETFNPHPTPLGDSTMWYHIEDIPKLPFDHNQIIEVALERLREKMHTNPIAFQLLPSYFALPDLQKLYETVLNTEIDKRNFRRKLMVMDFVQETEKTRKIGTHRPARLYRYNKQMYKAAVANGFKFNL